MESVGYISCRTSLNHFQFVYVILFIWIPHCGAIFKVGAHHRHVSHCFCFLAADSEITSQEAEHAVGFFHDPIDMRFPIRVFDRSTPRY